MAENLKTEMNGYGRYDRINSVALRLVSVSNQNNIDALWRLTDAVKV
jgi:hypothetical protein